MILPTSHEDKVEFMDKNAQRAIPAPEIKAEERIYRGEVCPVVKFDSGPFKNHIYVRYRGSLVHVGNRKMVAVSAEKIAKSEIKTETLVPYNGPQKEFMNLPEDANGNTKS